MEQKIIGLLEEILTELKKLNNRFDQSVELEKARMDQASDMVKNIMSIVPGAMKGGGQ